MLVDILRMPKVNGIPLERRIDIHTGVEPPLVSPTRTLHWPRAPLYHQTIQVGSAIIRPPSQLYKAIHVSEDERWVFETVFSQEDGASVCLYTKIISQHQTAIAISLEAIKIYRGECHYSPIVPVSHLLSGEQDGVLTPSSKLVPVHLGVAAVENLLPPIFGEYKLSNYLEQLLYIRKGGYQNRLGLVYKPIYDHIPGVFGALIEGRFWSSPFGEIVTHHPDIQIARDDWFLNEQVDIKVEARGITSYINHPLFDNLVLNIIEIVPSRLCVICRLGDAVDYLHGTWVTRECVDPYYALFGQIANREQNYFSAVTGLFYFIAAAYCRLFEIDSNVFVQNSRDESSIMITKNVYDEVEICIKDNLHGHYVSFYSSFPALALSTLATAIWF